MNDGLLALKRLKGEGRFGIYDETDICQDFEIAEYYLQALEIIKRNRYGAIQCLNYGCYEDYMVWHKCYLNVEPPLTQEEYDLLKEVLGND